MGSFLVKGVLWLSLVVMVSGCAPGISSQARSLVTVDHGFDELQRQPQRYMGEVVMLGGIIIETDVQDDVTELLVLQQDLDRSGRPRETDQSGGRFMVRSSEFLDPALYEKDMRITVVGEMAESRERLIGKMPYRYPVIDLIEIRKWPRQVDRSPRLHFGIGVGTWF